MRAPGHTSAPAATESARLRVDARAALRRLRCAPTSAIALELAATWEAGPPTAAAVAAVLGDDPTVHVLPDGRAIHLEAAVEGRLFTTKPVSCGGQPAVLHVEPDLAVALLPFRSWQRIPVRCGRHRGMAERARTGAGADLLVLDPDLVPAVHPLVAVQPGPEGLRLVGVAADDLATATLARSLVGPALASRVDPTQPSSWPAVDRLLLALTSDPSLCGAPAEPLGRVLAAHPGHRDAA